MSPGRLRADVAAYRQAGAQNSPPPLVPSDPLAAGLTPIEQLVRLLGLAANLGDEQDNIDGLTDHTERDILTSEAVAGFEEHEDGSAAGLNAIAGQDPSAQLAQQIPQLTTGIASALTGALSGAFQQIGQVPQQLTQGAQQAMQAGMSMLQQAGGNYLGSTEIDSEEPVDALDMQDPLDPLVDDLSAAGGSLGGFDGQFTGPGAHGGGAGAGGPGLMPPPLPLGPAEPTSAGTYLSSARTPTAAAPAVQTPASGGGMAGVPMVPPAAMSGAGNADKDGRTDTKRISVPPVRNGAPVQGRITAPPAESGPPRVVRGKPVATRRVVAPRERDQQATDPPA